MKLRELADHAGVTPDAVRYYVRIGLLVPERRERNGYRQFSEADVKRLRFIRRSKHLGFTLTEIAEIIQKSSQGETPCPMVRDIVQRRLTENADELEKLAALQERMQKALRKWRRMPDGVPDGDAICHLIESIDD